MDATDTIYHIYGTNVVYHIIVLIVAVVGIIRGFRKGFTAQICNVLGMGFGVVCTHIFTEQAAAFAKMLLPFLVSRPFPEYIWQLTGAAAMYTAVYYLFGAFTGVLSGALSIFSIGMFNKLVGAAFCLINYTLWLSIIYNLILGYNPEGALLRYASADDGNVVETVLDMTSGFLGCEGASELAHLVQLREAKKISCNYERAGGVILLVKTDPKLIRRENA